MINLDDYGDVGSAPPVEQSGIVKSTGNPALGGWDPVALGFAGMAVIAVAVSAGSAVPGLVVRGQVQGERAERLGKSVVDLSPSETEGALGGASPVWDSPDLINLPNGKKVQLSEWTDLYSGGYEAILNNARIPAGKYFGRNFVVVKELQGIGRVGQPNRVFGHGYGKVTPGKTAAQLTEFKKALAKAEGGL
jgi:hypothetical protein